RSLRVAADRAIIRQPALQDGDSGVQCVDAPTAACEAVWVSGWWQCRIRQGGDRSRRDQRGRVGCHGALRERQLAVANVYAAAAARPVVVSDVSADLDMIQGDACAVDVDPAAAPAG